MPLPLGSRNLTRECCFRLWFWRSAVISNIKSARSTRDPLWQFWFMIFVVSNTNSASWPLVTRTTNDADASEKFVCPNLFLSQKHVINRWWCIWEVCLEISLVSAVFGYHFWMLLFQTQIRFQPPLWHNFRTEMPLIQTQIRFRPPLWHDFAENWRISNGKGTYIRCWCIWEVCLP